MPTFRNFPGSAEGSGNQVCGETMIVIVFLITVTPELAGWPNGFAQTLGLVNLSTKCIAVVQTGWFGLLHKLCVCNTKTQPSTGGSLRIKYDISSAEIVVTYHFCKS